MNTNSSFAMPQGALGDIAFTTYLYYREARHVAATPSDFAAWLATLPASRRAHAESRGLASARSIPDFKRFLLERRGHSLTDFLAARLAPSVLAFWQALPDEDE
ncbi:hypothetical protein I2I05_09880 [Hymenobacter sp. BT683]|uniref:Uncharacterized protein n=1 Tax=Hymenobacter jeongseonensis TaxID=2791027 RepID=A0ABS0IHQ1_9BACT|nr:hypothetical protein [Hymenobacter jeongseonensis]MBF9237702.1 hypothetical protein [Hymenobacter jeongseonensis]